jgi:hypothetical protein
MISPCTICLYFYVPVLLSLLLLLLLLYNTCYFLRFCKFLFYDYLRKCVDVWRSTVSGEVLTGRNAIMPV